MARRSFGFTLVELLVVITILAILATIALTVFGSSQKNARDAKRISEINSIAKSLESSKDYTTNIYTNSLSTDFPNGMPVDPGSTTKYCIQIAASGAISSPTETAAWDQSGCPASYAEITTSSSFGTNKSWKLCAKKEIGATTVYCKASLTNS